MARLVCDNLIGNMDRLTGKLFAGLVGLSLMLINSAAAAQEPATGQAVGQQISTSFTTDDGTEVKYLIYRPSEENSSAATSYPLMLFLHGRGESQGGIERVAVWGPPQMAAKGEPFPFILVSPQCPPNDWWSSETQQGYLTELLDHIESRHPVDRDRVYLTGLSMGGYGSWALAARHPDRFAAVVPICGAGDTQWAEKLTAIPLWVFHGDRDEIIPLKKSSEMVDAIRAAGGTNVRFTTLEHIGHNSWSAAYGTPELYSWMLQQKRKSTPKN